MKLELGVGKPTCCLPREPRDNWGTASAGWRVVISSKSNPGADDS